MMARVRVKAKVLPRIAMVIARNGGKYGHKAETCWATRPSNPTEKFHGSKDRTGKQVHVLDEQDKAGEDAEKDIGGLSNALCAVHFGMTYADDEDG